MGLSYQQALEQARAIGEGAEVNIVISTNQDNGIVAYMQGKLIYHSAHLYGYILLAESLSTSSNSPLTAQFSNRNVQIGLAPQNFSIESEDKIGLSINQTFSGGLAIAHFTLQNWGNVQYSITMQSISDLLYGLGAPIGNQSPQALYTVAFVNVSAPVVLH